MTQPRNTHLYAATVTRSKEIDKLRKDLNLPPIKQGKRKCLRCDREFISEDLANLKMCQMCKNNGAKE